MLQVNVATGEVCCSLVDFSLPGFLPLEFERNYRSHLNRGGLVGWNWRHPLQTRLESANDGYRYIDEQGTATPLLAATEKGSREVTVAASENGRFRLRRTDSDTLTLTTPDRHQLTFHQPTSAGRKWALSKWEDAHGNANRFQYDSEGRLNRIDDSFDRQLHLFYAPAGQLVEVRLANPPRRDQWISLARYEYDRHGDLVGVRDACGHRYGFEYNDHLIVKATNRNGAAWYAQYDADRRCVATWLEEGQRLRRLRFDVRRQVTTVTDSRGATTTYRWNKANLVTDETDAFGWTKQTVLDNENALITVLDEAGLPTPLMTYDPDTRTRQIIDAAGATTTAVENDLGQIVSLVDGAGGTTEWSYDAVGKVVSRTDPLGARTQFDYDRHGRLSRTVDPLGHTTVHEYSADGRSVKVSDDLGLVSQYDYDLLGNLVGVVDGAGARRELQRDALGRLLSCRWPDDSRIEYRYDGEGNILEFVDELGHKWHYQRDAYGKCLKTTTPSGTTVRCEYDSEAELTRIVNENGAEHSFVYDLLGRVCQQNFFDGTSEHYYYDQRSDITQIIDGAGKSTAYVYDPAHSIVEKHYPNGVSETLAYDALRRPVELDNGTSKTTFQWDPAGNLVYETQGDRSLKYEYDAVGNRTRLCTSTGRAIRYTYDARDRLIQLIDSASGRYAFEYDPADGPKQTRFPNGTIWKERQDNRHRTVDQQLETPTGQQLKYHYEFDAADRLQRLTSSRGSTSFHYDRREHLTGVERGGQLVERFEYDAAGNLVFATGIGALDYETGNLLAKVGRQTVEHDPNGTRIRQLDGGPPREFEFGEAGRLVATTSLSGEEVTYSYDVLGRRVRKTVDGKVTDFLWDGFALLEEHATTGSVSYLVDSRRLVPLARVGEGRSEHYATDRRGCVAAVTDHHGDVVDEFEYTPFGQLKSDVDSQQSSPPFRLRGQYHDAETGLHYNLQRYYDPSTGRFLSRDPLGIDEGLNLYSFGLNPLTWEDPLGLSGECQGDVFYRAMSDKELKRVMADCQLKAKQSSCPEGPYVTQNRQYVERAQAKKPNDYKNLVEICTEPGTASGMTGSPLACRNGAQAAQFPNLPDVVAGNFHRIEHKMERGGLNYGLSKGDGLKEFNGKVKSMKVAGTGQTCTP